MLDDAAPTTFADAIDWIGSRSGHYAMKMVAAGIVISVKVGGASASVVASSTNELDLQDALIRAIADLRSAA